MSGEDNADKQHSPRDAITFKNDSWMNIGLVSIIVRNFVSSGMVPESKQLAEKYPDLAGRSVPICYFDIDRNGAYANAAIEGGKSPARIGMEYMRAAKYAIREFAVWIREHPDSEFARAKYIIGVSRLGSEEVGARLGFDIFTDVEPDTENPHHSITMAEDNYKKSGLFKNDEEALEKAHAHSVSIAVMPMARLLGDAESLS